MSFYGARIYSDKPLTVTGPPCSLKVFCNNLISKFFGATLFLIAKAAADPAA